MSEEEKIIICSGAVQTDLGLLLGNYIEGSVSGKKVVELLEAASAILRG